MNVRPAFAFVISLVVAACASTDPGPSTAGSDLASNTPSAKGNSAGGDVPTSKAPAPPTGSASAAAPAASGSASTSDGPGIACIDACGKQFPAGETKSDEIDAKAVTCPCAAEICAKQCAQSYCKDEGGEDLKDGDACSTCLDSAAAEACFTNGERACAADPDCAAYSKCVTACPLDVDRKRN